MIASMMKSGRTFRVNFLVTVTMIYLWVHMTKITVHSLESTSTTSPTSPADSQDNVTITSWQYCAGCKRTVDLYSKLTAEMLDRMQKAGTQSYSKLDAVELSNGLCDHAYFNTYQPFVHWSCVKIMSEHKIDFLSEFKGNVTAANLLNKADIFKRKRKVSKCSLLYETNHSY